LELFEVNNAADLNQALAAAASGNIDAIHAFPDGVTAESRVRIAEFALTRHLPSVFGWKEYAEAGGLISYGPNLDQSWRAIVIPLSGWIATGKPTPLTERQFPFDKNGVFWLGSGLRGSERSPEKARHEFKSQPGKAGFRVSRLLLLGGFSPLSKELL
jgi:hypothetical protein